MLRKLSSRRYKLPPWLLQKQTHRLAIAVLTAVLSFVLGEFFSSQGSWNQLPDSPKPPLLSKTEGISVDGVHAVSEPPQALNSTQLFIAIMTKPASLDSEAAARRQAIRETWLPRVQELTGVAAKFVIGKPADGKDSAELQSEIQKYPDDFVVLDVDECKRCGARKALAMLKSGWETHAPRWFLKVEDTVYVSPSHALQATRQWSGMHAEYVGCLQHGRPVEHYDLEAKQDADRDMISWQYHAHARKAAYAVSGDAVSVALLPNSDVLRMLQDEETSVALWMLAFKVNFWDDMRLCTPSCGNAAIAVSNNACDGLCSPIKDMHYFDGDSRCHSGRTYLDSALPYLDSYRENEMFHAMRV